MATTIRLTRMGKKKQPFYRLVVLDSRKRRDGAYLANLGYYNPFVEPHKVKLHEEEIIAWLKKGARVSETARSLLKAQGVLYRYSLVQQGLAVEEIEDKVSQWREGAEARVARWQQRRTEQQRLEIAAKAKAKAEAEKAALATAAEAEADAAGVTQSTAADSAAEGEAPTTASGDAGTEADSVVPEAAGDEAAEADTKDES